MAIRKQKLLIALAAVLYGTTVLAIEASDSYRSPRNPERPIRRSTELIVLHTTEAAARGSLKKLSERGECHYCVTEEGSIYRIVDRDREAFHAGRSMWNGKEDVDKFSIGIECVGYHDKPMSLIQLYAIRDLVKELKSMYHLSDDKVVCHSHVAYGAPNKWHSRKHRGRKQCGMLFAMPSVRKILDLKSRVAYDPDTKAKRLVVGDAYLEKVLYGKTDTMRGTYGDGNMAAVAPGANNSSGGIMSWLGFGKKQQSVSATPPPPSRTSARRAPTKPQRPQSNSGSSKSSSKNKGSTSSSSPPKSIADLKQQGYILKGFVSPVNTASKIAGARWNKQDTYYTIRNKVIPGSMINPAKIEKGMGIWMKR